jgi:hypothetical protein
MYVYEIWVILKSVFCMDLHCKIIQCFAERLRVIDC